MDTRMTKSNIDEETQQVDDLERANSEKGKRVHDGGPYPMERRYRNFVLFATDWENADFTYFQTKIVQDSAVCFTIAITIFVANYITYVATKVVSGTETDLLCLGVFFLLIALQLTSWVQTFITEAGSVPKAWSDLAKVQWKKHGKRLLSENHPQHVSVLPDTDDPQIFKPPRCHTIKRPMEWTVLNIDHWCLWVQNAIGFYNRKFFMLFLFYTWLALGFVVLTLSPHCHKYGRDVQRGSYGSLAIFVVSMVDILLLCVLSAFSAFHLWLVANNVTTMEYQGLWSHYNTSKENIYDVGWFRNMKQVFGTNVSLWLVPVMGDGPEGDGVIWPLQGEGTLGDFTNIQFD